MTLYNYLMQFKTAREDEIFEDSFFVGLADRWDANEFSKRFCGKPISNANFREIWKKFLAYCPNSVRYEEISLENLNENPVVGNKIYLPYGGIKKLDLTYNPTTYELDDPNED